MLLTRHLLDAGHRVIATDASPAMVELARQYRHPVLDSGSGAVRPGNHDVPPPGGRLLAPGRRAPRERPPRHGRRFRRSWPGRGSR